ncbi:MAG: imidazolonepropionase [Proteobacteria bacterium]|nr:imidazolonepropionase [Pseudomonadota bacterium]
MIIDLLLVNATLLSSKGTDVPNQAVAIAAGMIVFCGDMASIPAFYKEKALSIKDCKNNLVTPGLIDCHTHLIYAGNRAEEYKMRMEGCSYTEIAAKGGGILSTVSLTRKASQSELVEQSLPRLKALLNEGVTTVEIKSGYGLDLATEVKMLKAAKELEKITGLRIKKTFLGAHALPPEFKTNQQAYVDLICNEMIPFVAEEELADAVDVFCEKIAFNLEQTEAIFKVAKEHKLAIKCHAEQLSNIGASGLAANFKALSCDHLEYLSEESALVMKAAGTVAVLLPGAFYFLKEQVKPPIQMLRDLGISMAVATDSNTGTSPTTSLLLMMNMACQFFGLTTDEALKAVTSEAAKALGLEDKIGLIKEGMVADLVLWSIKESANLCYYFGYPLEKNTMIAGQWIN